MGLLMALSPPSWCCTLLPAYLLACIVSAPATFLAAAEAITSGSSGIEYERRRYERALGGRPASGAMPLTYAWLRDTLLQVRVYVNGEGG